MDTSQDERQRRMRAARALAGFKNVGDLADAIGADAGLGERTLRKLEGGESPLRPPAMREIAHACGLPYEFFTVDFSRLPLLAGADDDSPSLTGAEVRSLVDLVRSNSRRVTELEEAVATPTGALQDQLQALAEQVAALQADHATLATQVRLRTDASDTTTRDQDQPGQQR